MITQSHRRGLTITDVLVVTGTFTLLAAIALPATRTVSKRQRSASCLENLGRIAAASAIYTSEDATHQMVPMHRLEVITAHANGFRGYWSWKLALPQSFGGQTPTVPMPAEGGFTITIMMDESWWGASTRPLNPYILDEAGQPDLQAFHCPADTGYPYAATQWEIPAAPAEAAEIPCFDMLGNSYRANRCGIVWIAGPLKRGSMEVGPFGHTPGYILHPARTVLYCDPLFYAAARRLADGEPIDPLPGWHGTLMADNVAYSDGSVRLTEIGSLHQWTSQELDDTFFSPQYSAQPATFLCRGPSWQMDTNPAAGALVVTFSDAGDPLLTPDMFSGYSGWPFDNYTTNLSPIHYPRAAGPAGATKRP